MKRGGTTRREGSFGWCGPDAPSIDRCLAQMAGFMSLTTAWVTDTRTVEPERTECGPRHDCPPTARPDNEETREEVSE